MNKLKGNKVMINIALDGPSGAGKSTIARKVAALLGFLYIDTGALYRAIGLYTLESGIETTDELKVLPLLSNIKITLEYENGLQKVFLNGRDVTSDIRKPEVSMAASNVSAINGVRAFLLSLQQDIAKNNNCIMDGRDIGTVILPDAQIKIFLTASPEERATRRYDELKLKGFDVDYDTLLQEIKQRDFNDSNREIAPLKPAEGCTVFDTTGNGFEQSVELIYNHIKGALDVL